MSQLGLFDDQSSAVISPCGLYRYTLHRRWGGGPQVLFLMLNPSKADAVDPDPTMTRCVNFARSWGYDSLAIGNLFALRSTDPAALNQAADPIGPHNNYWLRELAKESRLIVAAWGNGGVFHGQDKFVRSLLANDDLYILKLTKEGQPWHPLYVKSDTKPTLWENRP